ncbi:MAG TPA: glutathione S-transferase family protein [Candidatus Dormibacteraeota bacterium]|nr:glutathione S-transferase family protein [Candidatus Dormibacteraeota bacterium]
MTLDRDHYYRFYGADVSYFTAKVRPALRYKRVPYLELLASPRAYREVIVPRTGLAFIPIVITDRDETWQDTSVILDNLEARFADPPLYPSDPVLRVLAYLVELYADEFLVLPAMHYRWSFPASIAKARADFAAVNGDPAAASRFADRMAGSIGFLGVSPSSIPGIEAHTRELLAAMSAHLAAHPYLLGGRPSLADCAVMGPFFAHLYQDAVPSQLLRETAPLVCHWMQRCNCPEPDAGGDYASPAALRPTLRPLLELIGGDAVPMLVDTVRAVEEWAATRPAGSDEPPRMVGGHPTTLRGAEVNRYTSPYALWMVQRPLDAYNALAPGERAAVDAYVAGTGCEALFALQPSLRLGKRGFTLVIETA